MEHRYSERIDLPLPVEVNYKDHPPMDAQVQNLSREGMFIQSHSQALTPGSLVYLTFHLPSSAATAFRIPAMVVHRQQTGIGVMFQTIPDQLEEALDILLTAAPDLARHQAANPWPSPPTDGHFETFATTVHLLPIRWGASYVAPYGILALGEAS